MMNREDAIILSNSIDANLAWRTILTVSVVECHCRSRTLPCMGMPNAPVQRRRGAPSVANGCWAAPPAPVRLRVLKKPNDVAVDGFDGCDQPSATDILQSVQVLDP